MPIYEYQCQECHNRFEKLQKLSDKPCKKCPSCGGALRKLISSPAIQFKGNGFYINDYAKKSSPDSESKSKDTSKEISKDTSKDASKDSSKDDASGEKPAKSKKAETIPPDKSC
jgi:putative FmdB family regulatory protein